MNEEVKKEKDEKEFMEKTEELKKKDDEKTEKNRRRRMKKKEKKGKGGKEADVEMKDGVKEQNGDPKTAASGNSDITSKANPNVPKGNDKKDKEREPSPQVEPKEGNGLIIHDDSD